jgi:hypothetical protein
LWVGGVAAYDGRVASGRLVFPFSRKETSMKKHAIRKMTLTRETLHLLEEASQEKLQEVAGGAWPVTTVKPYPCQATCLCP